MTEQEYLQKIHELEKQVLRLQTEIKKNSETQYGLRWMDVPEAFEAEAENAIPTLEEVPSKAISNDDGKPTHILIEGDNFHALTCLNYTHKGTIDVIYIDPPYNTGSDGFVYKDKRVLDKFPDGTTVPADHPLRHSYWLSFMHKRLELAKNLLSERGVIFISIDDNEQANLKLLCDQVFGEKNFVGNVIWEKTDSPRMDVKGFTVRHDYILVYAKSDFVLKRIFPNEVPEHYNKVDDSGKRYYLKPLRLMGGHKSDSLYYGIKAPDGTIIFPQEKNGEKGCWRWSLSKYNEEIERIEWIKGKNGWSANFRIYADNLTPIPVNTIWNFKKVGSTRTAKNELENIVRQNIFSYPKPSSLISFIEQIATNKSSTILDFFAGSGTTMHATMQLNEEDGGHRQCILVQQNENNICEAVTYERNKRVMQGYTNAKGEAVAGLGNSMKYYRTAFVGEHKITDITDADKVALTQKAGCLLALGENTLEEIKTAKSYQIFQLRKGDKPTNDFGYTAVYFSGNLLQFAYFRREIEQIQAANPLTRIAVYVFTWGDPSVFENEFDDLSGITIKPIPQPILEIYQNIHQL